MYHLLYLVEGGPRGLAVMEGTMNSAHNEQRENIRPSVFHYKLKRTQNAAEVHLRVSQPQTHSSSSSSLQNFGVEEPAGHSGEWEGPSSTPVQSCSLFR